MQTDAGITSMGQAAQAVFNSGPGQGPYRAIAFFNGIGATSTGYWLQGAAKFGGYEALKNAIYTRMHELPNGDDLCKRWRLGVMVTSAFGAEAVASAFLCPLEVLKLRIQTDLSYAARGLVGALAAVVRTEGAGALFKGFSAVCLRQLPYTAVKLVSYELFCGALVAAAARYGVEQGSMRLERARPFIAVTAGLLAGACAAVASQPADVLLTRICGSSAVSSLSSCVIATSWRGQLQYLYSLGLKECYAGMGARLAMVASMTSIQFLLYDQVRLRLGCDGPIPS